VNESCTTNEGKGQTVIKTQLNLYILGGLW
jgi:hypothetical protein